jgi:hypothetical protein
MRIGRKLINKFGSHRRYSLLRIVPANLTPHCSTKFAFIRCLSQATCRGAAGNSNANHCSLQCVIAPQHDAIGRAETSK